MWVRQTDFAWYKLKENQICCLESECINGSLCYFECLFLLISNFHSSSELFLTSRWYKQTSWVPIRCSLVLHLFNVSCFQKRSQPHSWLSVPAVPSALDLAEVVGQIWWKTTSVKTTTKSHSLPVPSDSPVVGFSPGKGTGPWSRDRLRERTQTAGSDRSLRWHQGKCNVKFLWWHSLSGKGVMWTWVQADKLTPLAERTQPLPSHKWKISQKMFSFAVS